MPRWRSVSFSEPVRDVEPDDRASRRVCVAADDVAQAVLELADDEGRVGREGFLGGRARVGHEEDRAHENRLLKAGHDLLRRRGILLQPRVG